MHPPRPGHHAPYSLGQGQGRRLARMRLPGSSPVGHTGATSGPQTTGSQRTTAVTTGPGSSQLTRQTSHGAAGRRSPHGISDTERVTGSSPPASGAARGRLRRPCSARLGGKPGLAGGPERRRTAATGPRHHPRRPRQSRTCSGPVGGSRGRARSSSSVDQQAATPWCREFRASIRCRSSTGRDRSSTAHQAPSRVRAVGCPPRARSAALGGPGRARPWRPPATESSAAS
jgi:hypothetical protein